MADMVADNEMHVGGEQGGDGHIMCPDGAQAQSGRLGEDGSAHDEKVQATFDFSMWWTEDDDGVLEDDELLDDDMAWNASPCQRSQRILFIQHANKVGGSLSPLGSLRQCALGDNPERRRSWSPLRPSPNDGFRVVTADACQDSVHPEEGCEENDDLDSFRGLCADGEVIKRTESVGFSFDHLFPVRATAHCL